MERYEHEAYMVNLGTDCASKMNRKKNGNYVRHDEAQAEIDRLKADLFEAKREYVQRQEWSAKQTEVVIKGLKEEIDRLKSDFIRLHTMAVKWVDKDHHDWQELMKLRWDD